MRPPSRWTKRRAGLLAAVSVFGLAGWQGVTTFGRSTRNDSGAHERYAAWLSAYKHFPPAHWTTEYWSPPLYDAAGVAARSASRLVAWPQIEVYSNLVTRALWLALALSGAACMTAAAARIRVAGLAFLALAAAWAGCEAFSLAQEDWEGGQLISLAACFGLAAVTALIARELWPDHPRRAAGAVAALLAYPVVFRMGVLFHPEMTFAFIISVILLLVIRAERRGWPRKLAVATGVACGLAALTRPTAVLVILCVIVAAAVAGGRQVRPFVLTMLAACFLVAGPWWGYAADRWGNPLRSELNRPGQMISYEPRSFYVSFPLRSIVEHPYRPAFTNELFPKLHAELWSDWFGVFHGAWESSTRLERVTASSQSVLGLVDDALGLAGLGIFGIPAVKRLWRDRRARSEDFAAAFLTFVALAAFAAFLLTVISYPQRDGDPIKATYLLFTAPCWALFVVAGWSEARRRSAAAAVVLPLWAVLYGISFVLTMSTAKA